MLRHRDEVDETMLKEQAAQKAMPKKLNEPAESQVQMFEEDMEEAILGKTQSEDEYDSEESPEPVRDDEEDDV